MMMDNDFPMISKETSNPRSPYDVYKAPDWAKPKYPQQPQEPEKEGPVKNAAGLGYLQEYVSGMNRYQQAGTDVPDFGMQTDYTQQSGGPLMEQTLLAGNPSFDLKFPKMPGIGTQNQSIEGIPNASPELLRKFVERKLKNPGGQELPGFLKGA